MRFRILASIFTLAFAGMAAATPIKFEYTGTGSGDLAGSSFSSAAFTITAFGDTDDRQDYSAGYFIDHLSASIDIAGVGSFDFLTGTRTFVNNLANVVGFSRAGITGNDLYNGPFEGVGAPWDMLSNLSLAGTFGLFQWDMSPVDTNGGVLSFISSTGPGTFTATLVPEPMTFGLMAVGLFAVVWMRRRPAGPAR